LKDGLGSHKYGQAFLKECFSKRKKIMNRDGEIFNPEDRLSEL